MLRTVAGFVSEETGKLRETFSRSGELSGAKSERMKFSFERVE